jgi:hypothetical protein
METQGRARVAREEWAKRVEWRDSGLSCAEFAAEVGVNPRTLTYWKWVLGKEARGEKRAWPSRKGRGPRPQRAPVDGATTSAASVVSSLVEVHAAPRDARFELELGAGRRTPDAGCTCRRASMRRSCDACSKCWRRRDNETLGIERFEHALSLVVAKGPRRTGPHARRSLGTTIAVVRSPRNAERCTRQLAPPSSSAAWFTLAISSCRPSARRAGSGRLPGSRRFFLHLNDLLRSR